MIQVCETNTDFGVCTYIQLLYVCSTLYYFFFLPRQPSNNFLGSRFERSLVKITQVLVLTSYTGVKAISHFLRVLSSYPFLFCFIVSFGNNYERRKRRYGCISLLHLRWFGMHSRVHWNYYCQLSIQGNNIQIKL